MTNSTGVIYYLYGIWNGLMFTVFIIVKLLCITSLEIELCSQYVKCDMWNKIYQLLIL